MKSSVTRLLKIVIYLLHQELQKMHYTDVLFTNVLVPNNTKQTLTRSTQVLLPNKYWNMQEKEKSLLYVSSHIFPDAWR